MTTPDLVLAPLEDGKDSATQISRELAMFDLAWLDNADEAIPVVAASAATSPLYPTCLSIPPTACNTSYHLSPRLPNSVSSDMHSPHGRHLKNHFDGDDVSTGKKDIFLISTPKETQQVSYATTPKQVRCETFTRGISSAAFDEDRVRLLRAAAQLPNTPHLDDGDDDDDDMSVDLGIGLGFITDGLNDAISLPLVDAPVTTEEISRSVTFSTCAVCSLDIGWTAADFHDGGRANAQRVPPTIDLWAFLQCEKNVNTHVSADRAVNKSKSLSSVVVSVLGCSLHASCARRCLDEGLLVPGDRLSLQSDTTKVRVSKSETALVLDGLVKPPVPTSVATAISQPMQQFDKQTSTVDREDEGIAMSSTDLDNRFAAACDEAEHVIGGGRSCKDHLTKTPKCRAVNRMNVLHDSEGKKDLCAKTLRNLTIPAASTVMGHEQGTVLHYLKQSDCLVVNTKKGDEARCPIAIAASAATLDNGVTASLPLMPPKAAAAGIPDVTPTGVRMQFPRIQACWLDREKEQNATESLSSLNMASDEIEMKTPQATESNSLHISPSMSPQSSLAISPADMHVGGGRNGCVVVGGRGMLREEGGDGDRYDEDPRCDDVTITVVNSMCKSNNNNNSQQQAQQLNCGTDHLVSSATRTKTDVSLIPVVASMHLNDSEVGEKVQQSEGNDACLTSAWMSPQPVSHTPTRAINVSKATGSSAAASCASLSPRNLNLNLSKQTFHRRFQPTMTPTPLRVIKNNKCNNNNDNTPPRACVSSFLSSSPQGKLEIDGTDEQHKPDDVLSMLNKLPSWLRADGAENMLRLVHVAQNVDGSGGLLNRPQVCRRRAKTTGNVHVDSGDFCHASLNVSTGVSEWGAVVNVKHQHRLRQLLWMRTMSKSNKTETTKCRRAGGVQSTGGEGVNAGTNHSLPSTTNSPDTLSAAQIKAAAEYDMASWVPDIGFCLRNNVPVVVMEQHRWETVVFSPICLHWVFTRPSTSASSASSCGLEDADDMPFTATGIKLKRASVAEWWTDEKADKNNDDGADDDAEKDDDDDDNDNDEEKSEQQCIVEHVQVEWTLASAHHNHMTTAIQRYDASMARKQRNHALLPINQMLFEVLNLHVELDHKAAISCRHSTDDDDCLLSRKTSSTHQNKVLIAMSDAGRPRVVRVASQAHCNVNMAAGPRTERSSNPIVNALNVGNAHAKLEGKKTKRNDEVQGGAYLQVDQADSVLRVLELAVSRCRAQLQREQGVLRCIESLGCLEEMLETEPEHSAVTHCEMPNCRREILMHYFFCHVCNQNTSTDAPASLGGSSSSLPSSYRTTCAGASQSDTCGVAVVGAPVANTTVLSNVGIVGGNGARGIGNGKRPRNRSKNAKSNGSCNKNSGVGWRQKKKIKMAVAATGNRTVLLVCPVEAKTSDRRAANLSGVGFGGKTVVGSASCAAGPAAVKAVEGSTETVEKRKNTGEVMIGDSTGIAPAVARASTTTTTTTTTTATTTQATNKQQAQNPQLVQPLSVTAKASSVIATRPVKAEIKIVGMGLAGSLTDAVGVSTKRTADDNSGDKHNNNTATTMKATRTSHQAQMSVNESAPPNAVRCVAKNAATHQHDTATPINIKPTATSLLYSSSSNSTTETIPKPPVATTASTMTRKSVYSQTKLQRNRTKSAAALAAESTYVYSGTVPSASSRKRSLNADRSTLTSAQRKCRKPVPNWLAIGNSVCVADTGSRALVTASGHGFFTLILDSGETIMKRRKGLCSLGSAIDGVGDGGASAAAVAAMYRSPSSLLSMDGGADASASDGGCSVGPRVDRGKGKTVGGGGKVSSAVSADLPRVCKEDVPSECGTDNKIGITKRVAPCAGDVFGNDALADILSACASARRLDAEALCVGLHGSPPIGDADTVDLWNAIAKLSKAAGATKTIVKEKGKEEEKYGSNDATATNATSSSSSSTTTACSTTHHSHSNLDEEGDENELPVRRVNLPSRARPAVLCFECWADHISHSPDHQMEVSCFQKVPMNDMQELVWKGEALLAVMRRRVVALRRRMDVMAGVPEHRRPLLLGGQHTQDYVHPMLAIDARVRRLSEAESNDLFAIPRFFRQRSGGDGNGTIARAAEGISSSEVRSSTLIRAESSNNDMDVGLANFKNEQSMVSLTFALPQHSIKYSRLSNLHKRSAARSRSSVLDSSCTTSARLPSTNTAIGIGHTSTTVASGGKGQVGKKSSHHPSNNNTSLFPATPGALSPFVRLDATNKMWTSAFLDRTALGGFDALVQLESVLDKDDGDGDNDGDGDSDGCGIQTSGHVKVLCDGGDHDGADTLN